MCKTSCEKTIAELEADIGQLNVEILAREEKVQSIRQVINGLKEYLKGVPLPGQMRNAEAKPEPVKPVKAVPRTPRVGGHPGGDRMKLVELAEKLGRFTVALLKDEGEKIIGPKPKAFFYNTVTWLKAKGKIYADGAPGDEWTSYQWKGKEKKPEPAPVAPAATAIRGPGASYSEGTRVALPHDARVRVQIPPPAKITEACDCPKAVEVLRGFVSGFSPNDLSVRIPAELMKNNSDGMRIAHLWLAGWKGRHWIETIGFNLYRITPKGKGEA